MGLGTQVSRDPLGPGPQRPLKGWAAKPITDPLQIEPLGFQQIQEQIKNGPLSLLHLGALGHMEGFDRTHFCPRRNTFRRGL